MAFNQTLRFNGGVFYSSNDKLDEGVLSALRAGDRISDEEFDRILPPRYEALSDVQWSPVKVSRVIARMLADRPRASFVDLGCGVGKLCLLLALTTDLEVHGIERRKALVSTGERLAKTNGARVNFIAGDMMDLDWSRFDVLYLYNPFMEQKCSPRSGSLIDGNIRLGNAEYSNSVDRCFAKLCELRPGQRVITYHGFGGMVPSELKLIDSERVASGTVRMWSA